MLLIKQALEREARITYEAVVARYGPGPGEGVMQFLRRNMEEKLRNNKL